MRSCHAVLGLGLGLGLVLSPAVGRADPVPMKPGKIVLPMTGLAIELPRDARKNATWMVSGSWSLSDGGASFDGRDVIDLKVGDKLVAGNWIHIGYFNAGDCAAVVKELDVPDRWTDEKVLYGQKFQVAGGTWDFENDLGKKPAVALCTSTAGGQSLLLYHFFLEAKPPTGKALFAALAKDKLLASTTKAWKTGKYGPVQTTKHPEIKQRGDIPAVRTVTLPTTKLEVALPDDGFIWLVRAGTDGSSDFLDRMAPSLPDLTLEVARADSMSCADLKTAMEGVTWVPEPGPPGVSDPWTSYGTIKLDTGLERVICAGQGSAALVVGLLGTPPDAAQSRDFTPLIPVLQALYAGTVKP